MKNIAIGVLAHVDSGKTTLSESMLYKKGHIRKLGRVDHKDTFLDNLELEKQRGITIFSKQAVINTGNTNIYLIDTPGHVDFSAEMERTCKVLDYAVLVVDGSSELKNHTYTLWKLLAQYNIPTFIFINKMDMSLRTKEEVMSELHRSLTTTIIEYKSDRGFYEDIAACSERLFEKYMLGEEISNSDIARVISNREAFMCCFGSALKLEGIDELLWMLDEYTLQSEEVISHKSSYELSREVQAGKSSYASARVYKISRDDMGNRLTHMKITGGVLKVKDLLKGKCILGDETWEEKVNQIRVYSGVKYDLVNEATVGMVVAVTGLNQTYAGEGIGDENDYVDNMLQPVLSYTVHSDEMDSMKLYNTISVLSDEDSTLQITWDSVNKAIEIKLMGPIQLEVLSEIIKDRFGLLVTFSTGNIIYKETIEEPVVGVGHFEPLRHYAEAHLRISPGKPGSGIVAESDVSEDMLDKNWQRLIITHIKEKKHKGVLTGSELTDVRIAVVAGRAHKKHTEGGDFRQATYRAIRQGLMKAKSVLLEPVYEFSLHIQRELVGRAMTDIENMSGRCESPEIIDDMAIVRGYCPVATMMDYSLEVLAYSKGRGVLHTRVAGYEKCHNSDEIIALKSYDPLADIKNTPDSVFCAGGAGMTIAYNRVEEFMHIPMDYLKKNSSDYSAEYDMKTAINAPNNSNNYADDSVRDSIALDKELMDIFEKTYGPVKRKTSNQNNYASDYLYTSKSNATKVSSDNKKDEEAKYIGNYVKKNPKEKEPYLLVDGYNVIFADDTLSELAKDNLDGARYKLMDMLSNYKGVKNDKIMVVFDAYRIKGNIGSVSEYNNITVVFTKEAETADAYIERFAHDNAKKYDITVATSDGLEQIIILGEGSKLKSSRELLRDMKEAVDVEVKNFDEKKESGKVYIGEIL